MRLCPLCGLEMEETDLTRHYLKDVRVIRVIKSMNPSWTPEEGACSRCLENFYQEVSIRRSLQEDQVDEQTVITMAEALIAPRTAESNLACLITIHGMNLGKKFDIGDGEHIIGRAENAQIRVNEENVSRQHARIYKNGPETIIEDLNSTNGTFINTKKITSHVMKDGDLLLIGNTILKFASGTNVENRYHEEIYRLATIDGLTQVHNKSFFLERVADEFSRSKRYGRDLSIIIFDFDHFKKLNDTYGHLAGDEVLKQSSSVILLNLRKEDPIGRYGGEEFGILLPETPLNKAMTLAEKIRKLIERTPFSYNDQVLRVTISMGVSTLTSNVETVQKLIENADQALYRAKKAGRNRVSS